MDTLETVEFSTYWLIKLCYFTGVLESTNVSLYFGALEFYLCVPLCRRSVSVTQKKDFEMAFRTHFLPLLTPLMISSSK